jgi:hypothetical protein
LDTSEVLAKVNSKEITHNSGRGGAWETEGRNQDEEKNVPFLINRLLTVRYDDVNQKRAIQLIHILWLAEEVQSNVIIVSLQT